MFRSLLLLLVFLASPAVAQVQTRITMGTVVDTAGHPIPGAKVLCRVWNPEKLDLFKEVLTDLQGNFRLTYEESDTAINGEHLWAWAPGYQLKCVSNMDRKLHKICLEELAEDNPKFSISLPNGVPAAEVSVQPYAYEMPNGVYESDVKTGLSGFLPDAIANGLAVIADENGNVQLVGCNEKLLRSVKVTSAEYGTQVFPSRIKKIKLVRTGKLRVTLENFDRARDFNGSILVQVEANPAESTYRAKFDSEGMCEFANLVPGQLSLSLVGNMTHELRFKVPEQLPFIEKDKLTKLTLPLVQTVPITGRIVAGEEGVPGARISIRDGNNRQAVLTGKDGEFSAKVFPGALDLQVFVLPGWIQKDYRYPASKKLQVEPRDELDIEFNLPKQTKVSGKLLQADGQPVQSGYVAAYVIKPFGFPAFAGHVSSEGRFESAVWENRWQNKAEGELDIRWFASPKDRMTDRSKGSEVKIVTKKPLVLQLNE
ncbi:MAG: carboxypeptidase-like regulatory domain-containing protein [Planctomycetota bacterium]